MNFKKLLIVLVVLGLTGTLFAQEKIQLMFSERPPYMVSDGQGGVIGLTASVADYAFKKANIPFEWVDTTSQRQMAMVKENSGKVAGVGWFKKPEREIFAKFSNSLYQDKQIIVLARKDNAIISSQTSIQTLLANQSLTLLVKSGYSYGNFIDDKISTIKPKIYNATGEPVNMIKMINANRADYMFISPEEAENVISEAGFSASDFQQVTLNDMPVGQNRYIMFSQKVDDATIKLINKYIDEYLSAHK